MKLPNGSKRILTSNSAPRPKARGAGNVRTRRSRVPVAAVDVFNEGLAA